MYRPSRRGFLASGAAALTCTLTRPGRAAAASGSHRLVPGPATAPLLGDDAPVTPVWAYGGRVPGPEIRLRQGGFEAELGGLWLTDADIVFRKGGFSLDISEPLKEPLQRLKINGAMGGFEADNLGNASPKVVDVQCRMGGAEIDLRGQCSENGCNCNMVKASIDSPY